MRKQNIVATLLGVILIAGAAVVGASASDMHSADKSYNVLSHVIVGSNSVSARDSLNQGLSSAVDAIKSDFKYQSYSTETSHFQSVGNGGNFSFQSMMRSLGSLSAATENPIFSDWSYGGFYVDKDEPGAVGFKSFRFQARVPVNYKGVENAAGSTSFVKYEMLKLGLNNVQLTIGQPKVIASLPMPVNGESLFFVIEVRQSARP